MQDFDDIRRLAFEIGTETSAEIAAVIAGERLLQVFLRASSRSFEAVGQNCCARLNVLAGMKHGFVIQTICFQVVSVNLHQAHTEIASLSVQYFGGGNSLFVSFRLPFQSPAHHADGIWVEPALHPRHGLQGIGVNITPTLSGELIKRNPLFVNKGLGCSKGLNGCR